MNLQHMIDKSPPRAASALPRPLSELIKSAATARKYNRPNPFDTDRAFLCYLKGKTEVVFLCVGFNELENTLHCISRSETETEHYEVPWGDVAPLSPEETSRALVTIFGGIYSA